MSHIYEQAKDVHVRATYVYAKAGDAYAYSDSDNTVKIKAAELKEIFDKGAIVVAGAVEYKPVSLGVDAGVATMTYVKTDADTATTAVLATLVSEEYTVA